MRLVKHVLGSVLIVAAGGACSTNEPDYIPGPTNLEGGVTPMMMGGFVPVKASLTLPIKPESTADATARMALATQLGCKVPYVKVGDIDVSIEWTIKNLDTANAGTAVVELNGGNEWEYYDPSTIMLDPNSDDPPPTPGLSGDIPMSIPAGGTLSGLFTEDQVLSASIAFDEISQGNFDPYAATLVDPKNETSFQPLSPPVPADPSDPDDTDTVQMPVGNPIPRAAFAQLVRLDLVFKPDSHMVLDYDVVVRDIRGILPNDLMNTPAGDLTQFDPTLYVMLGTSGSNDGDGGSDAD